jgi:L-amino acid N-acyltransferase YncA
VSRRSPQTARLAKSEDAAAIARIYNEGIEDRLATFETRPRSEREVAGWLEEAFPLVVVEDEAGAVVAWASAPPSSEREAYRGVANFSVYVKRAARAQGLGRLAVEALVREAQSRASGSWSAGSSPRTKRA